MKLITPLTTKFLAVIIIIFSCASFSFQTIILRDPISSAYEVGQVMKIEWTNTANSSDANITIDLVNDRPEVMIEAYIIAQKVPITDLIYTWTLPRYLKSSSDYHLRIYLQGQIPPCDPSHPGYGKAFKLVNPNPLRQSTLTLLEPTGSPDGSSLESTCLTGEQCFILWDYPEWGAETTLPEHVDIKLYSGDRVLLVLAERVPVNLKQFTWSVPVSLGSKDPVHVVISASDRKLPKQGQSVYLASSGYPFVLESRIEREEGNLANYKSNQIDFSAPDPINNDESEKIVAGVKAEYTSDALKVEPTLVVFISLISISLFTIMI